MAFSVAAVYTAILDRAKADATLQSLVGAFPASFPLDPTYAGEPAIFEIEHLSRFAGKGVVLPWLVGGPFAASPGWGMRDITVAFFAYARPGAGTAILEPIADALESVFGTYKNRHAIAWGSTAVTHRGRTFTDTSLENLDAIEVRVTHTRFAT